MLEAGPLAVAASVILGLVGAVWGMLRSQNGEQQKRIEALERQNGEQEKELARLSERVRSTDVVSARLDRIDSNIQQLLRAPRSATPEPSRYFERKPDR